MKKEELLKIKDELRRINNVENNERLNSIVTCSDNYEKVKDYYESNIKEHENTASVSKSDRLLRMSALCKTLAAANKLRNKR